MYNIIVSCTFTMFHIIFYYLNNTFMVKMSIHLQVKWTVFEKNRLLKLAAILDFGRKYWSHVITNMFNGFLVCQNMGIDTKKQLAMCNSFHFITILRFWCKKRRPSWILVGNNGKKKLLLFLLDSLDVETLI